MFAPAIRRRRANARPVRRPRLQLTALEDRAVPAALILDDTGLLTYTAATFVANNLSVSYNAVAGRYTFSELGVEERGIAALGPFADLTGQATRNVSFAAANVSAIVVNLGERADTIRVGGVNDPLTINGGTDSDLLWGPGGENTWSVAALNGGFLTGTGLARAVTFASIERLLGNTGTDRFVIGHRQGVSGHIDGGPGTDALDYSAWGTGVSVSLATRGATGVGAGVYGIEGVTGGRAGDSLVGGLGANELRGGPGNDTMNGGPGRDSLSGGDGDDSLDGADGGDRLWGDAGTDRLYGAAGDDSLHGGAGSDYLHGEGGNDRLGAYPSGFEWVDDPGDDVMYGADGNDSLAGGFGNDRLDGGPANDLLHGDVGNDSLQGGSGNDNLYGDAHNDKLFGGEGGDILYGGEGEDTLVGIDNTASDLLLGEGGLDSFWADEMTSPAVFADAMLDLSPDETRLTVHKVRRFENGADRTLDADAIPDPTDGHNYRNFSLLPLFPGDGPSESDIDQGDVGDCWLMAAMGAIARANPNAIRQIITELGDGTFAVRLGNRYYRVDGDLPAVDWFSTRMTFAGVGRENSIWAPLVEKAYAHFRTGANTYASLDGGWEIDALRAFNGSDLHSRFVGLGAIFADDNRRMLRTLLDGLGTLLDTGTAVTVGFDWVVPTCPCFGRHAYTLVGVNRDAAGQVVSVQLRNPHGWDGFRAPDHRADDDPLDSLVTVTIDQLLFSGTTISWACVV